MPSNRYSDSVFINCPFDAEYRGKFRACVFTVLDSGFIPRCSFEINDGGIVRFHAITQLIADCRYGIHDISRIQLDENSGLPRFNMPFELGLFHGAKHIGPHQQKNKQCLILEKRSYRYQKYLSDISGIDVTPHNDSVPKLIIAVRNWLMTASRRSNIPSAVDIGNRYRSFDVVIRRFCRERNVTYEDMPFVELVQNMTDWLRVNQIAPIGFIESLRNS